MLKNLILLVVITLISACSDERSPKPWHVDAAPESKLDPEQERIRLMQSIRVFDKKADGGNGDYAELSASTFLWRVRGECALRHNYKLKGAPDAQLTCDDFYVMCMADVAVDTCAVNKLREIVETSNVGVEIRAAGNTPNDNFHYLVPPQSEAARLSLMLETRKMAQRLAFKAGFLLKDTPYDGGTNSLFGIMDKTDPVTGQACLFKSSALKTQGNRYEPIYSADATGSGPLDGRTVAAVVVEGITTGERAMREVSQQAAEKMLAVAEWERGSTDAFALAQERVYSRPGLSRASAAHLLVGGSEGLRLDTSPTSGGLIPTTTAFCSAGRLSPSAERALKALRQTGVDPARILDGTTTAELVDGTAGGSGSVKQRMGVLTGKTITSATEALGLSLADFTEARQFLADELRAFNRSRVATIGSLGTYSKFAATSTPVPVRPKEYYTAIARSEPIAGDYFKPIDFHSPQLSQNGVFDWAETRDLASFEGILQSQTALALQHMGAPGADLEYELRPLYLAIQSWQNTSRAVVAVARSAALNAPILVQISAPPYLPLSGAPAAGLTLVTGEDQLECALRGNIEGAACTLTGQTLTAVATNIGGRNIYSSTFSTATPTTLSNGRNYVLGKKSNGEAELIASFPVLNVRPTGAIEMVFAVMPEVERQAADMIRPSSAWCARGAVQCNNNLFDERMPLENELNNDGNGIEDSWKYYLGRAKDAAAAADQLGEVYLNAQLSAQHDEVQAEAEAAQARERVQQHLEVLQGACGVSMDADSLLKLFGATGALEDVTAGDCTSTCGSIPDPKNVRQCIGGQCLIVPTLLVSHQDSTTVSSRLTRCLGASQTIPLTTYGDRPVCVHNTNVAADLCKNDAQCPRLVPEASSVSEAQAAQYCTNAGYKVVYSKLGFFKTTDTLFTPLPRTSKGLHAPGMCRHIVKANKIDGAWFKRTPFSRWLGNDAGEDRKDCVPRTNLPPEQVAIGWGYDPATVEIDSQDYTFPLWEYGNEGKSTPNGPHLGTDAGVGMEFLRCPTEAELTDPAMLAKLEQLPIDMRTWVLSLAGECLAAKLEDSLGRRLIASLPQDVLDILKDVGPTGAFPTIGGDYAQLVTDLRGALIQQHDNVRLIRDEMKAYSDDLEKFRIAFQKQGLAHTINNLMGSELEQETIINDARLEIEEIKQDDAMTLGVFSYVARAASTPYGVGIVDVSPIAGAMKGDEILDQERRIHDAQAAIIGLKLAANKAQERMLQLDDMRDQLEARAALRRHVSAIQGFVDQVRLGREAMDGKLAELENLRYAARRALDAAIAASSPQLVQSEKKLVKVAGNIAELHRLRYKEAYDNAVRLAFLAKRAIEIRLGVRFSEMTERLPLLDAPPASWENDVCVASGIDYQRLQDAAPGKLPDGTLNGFLGTYVRKLENVVDAYQLAYAFEEGRDSMALSLKDDVFRSTADCEVLSPNLLAESAEVLGGGTQTNLASIDAGPSTKLSVIVADSWKPAGCTAGTACVFTGDQQELLGDLGDLKFASSVNLYTNVVGASLRQGVDLESGSFVLSWYQLDSAPDADLGIADSLGAAVSPVASGAAASHAINSKNWVRRWRVFNLPKGHFDVVVKPNTGTGAYRHSSFAAPMLEAVDTDQQTITPGLFAVTGTSKLIHTPCQDIDSSTFRNQWVYQCERTCGVAGGTACSDSASVERCFWETTFRLSEKEIELGRILRFAGFASGNFNYRLESLGLNLVATAPRDCARVGGSSCYAIGYVPYSLYQTGPFTTRNHAGSLVEAPLFNGRIEMAKGLAAERYLTNPLSSTDKELLEPYLRTEFRGRPLDGTYVVRIWEDDSLDFGAMEDVQLFINYRYWTPAK